MIYNNYYYKIHNNRRIIINIQMIENATSEKNGFTNKESGFNAFYFFCCPTTKTVFNKKCGLVVILARTNRVSPAYHLHKWGGLAWLSHSQILNQQNHKTWGFHQKCVDLCLASQLGSFPVEKTAWICQTFLPPHGLGPSNHPEKPRPGHRTVAFLGKLPASGKLSYVKSTICMIQG